MAEDEQMAALPVRELEKLKARAEMQAPRGDRASMRRTGEQIRFGPLQPWMFAYGEWLVLTCLTPPTRTTRIAKMRSLSRTPVNDRQVRELEARDDFAKYCDELAKGPLEEARAKFVRHFPEYIEAHAEALDSARRAGDYTAVARIAEPVLDRVVPRKAEGIQATQVTVVLTPQQVAGVHAYSAPPILVQEATPAPALDDGDSVPVLDD